MKMWIAGTALALTFGMSSLALAACSPEEAQAKAEGI